MNQNQNAIVLLEYMTWLEKILLQRLDQCLNNTESVPIINPDKPPTPSHPDVPLAAFIRQHQLTRDEQLILIIALAPHVNPEFYNRIIKERIKDGNYPLLGLIKSDLFKGYMPTGATAVFVLAGIELNNRLEALRYFAEEHLFAKMQVLHLETAVDGDPSLTGKIILAQDFIDRFLTGSFTRPRLGPDFPAELITTELEWNDLVLTQETLDQVKQLKKWLFHKDHLYKTNKRLKPGYRALFYGPPGTGKTLTSCLLGKGSPDDGQALEYDVYRIDLSLVVSKFIGETEKNLSRLFVRAEHKNWILFFDEADALFGKRTNVRDAHDKYANQEISYLLQKIENYNGLLILASNFKANIDTAFSRRFQSIIHFAMPGPAERLKLWKGILTTELMEDESQLEAIATSYELSGASILNVAQACFLQNMNQDGTIDPISKSDLEVAIAREFTKEGKILK